MEYNLENTILNMHAPYYTLPCIISADGVSAENGKKVIKAGTPVGGDDNVLLDRTKKLKSTNTSTLGAKTQGILIHDVDVTDGDASGTVAFMGVIDMAKVDSSITIDSAVKFPYDIILMKGRKF